MKTFILVVAAGLFACGSNVRPSGSGPRDMVAVDWTLGFGSEDDLSLTSIDPGVGDLAVSNDCPDSAKLVYVVDENNMLSSFKPDTLKFVDIGTLNCPAQLAATPFSMAVDRNALAWVLYNSGEIFTVDTMTAKCTPTKWVPGTGSYTNFGMGYVSNSALSTDETLFISDDIGMALGTINTKNFSAKTVGMLSGQPELTGTGDAKLWGFFPDLLSPRVSQLNKMSGAESNVYPLAMLKGQPLAWAFAFWGGDFWIFLKRSNDTSTIVWHLKANGNVSKALTAMNRTIVGAGVSTCAPLMIQ